MQSHMDDNRRDYLRQYLCAFRNCFPGIQEAALGTQSILRQFPHLFTNEYDGQSKRNWKRKRSKKKRKAPCRPEIFRRFSFHLNQLAELEPPLNLDEIFVGEKDRFPEDIQANPELYLCGVCGISAGQSAVGFSNHVWKHVGNALQKVIFRCRLCDLGSCNLPVVQSHLQSVHALEEDEAIGDAIDDFRSQLAPLYLHTWKKCFPNVQEAALGRYSVSELFVPGYYLNRSRHPIEEQDVGEAVEQLLPGIHGIATGSQNDGQLDVQSSLDTEVKEVKLAEEFNEIALHQPEHEFQGMSCGICNAFVAGNREYFVAHVWVKKLRNFDFLSIFFNFHGLKILLFFQVHVSRALKKQLLECFYCHHMTISVADIERHCLIKHKAINYHDFRRNFIREFLLAFRRCFPKLEDSTLFFCIFEDLWKFSNAPPSASKQIQANVDNFLAEQKIKQKQKTTPIQLQPSFMLASDSNAGATLVFNPSTKTFGLALQSAPSAPAGALRKLKIISIPSQGRISIPNQKQMTEREETGDSAAEELDWEMEQQETPTVKISSKEMKERLCAQVLSEKELGVSWNVAAAAMAKKVTMEKEKFDPAAIDQEVESPTEDPIATESDIEYCRNWKISTSAVTHQLSRIKGIKASSRARIYFEANKACKF